ncbi:GLIPR1-like protein 1 [Misgurnus anguillicaudatus]|uniref:GLIPR1-like protein 1 n=1 Tax=Misgurnus anguillicaudatus TaxID=75329 RepID=UPI003CCFB129
MSIRDIHFCLFSSLCFFSPTKKMSNFLHILLHVIGLLHFVPHAKTTEPLYDITDPAFIDECVTEHNRHRANVNPPASNMRYMTWDEGLARSAQAWARNCFPQNNPYNQPGRMHPIFTIVGENNYACAPCGNNFKVQSAIKAWMSQDQHYNYDSNKCSRQCSRYLQVVWADTYKVGCAAQVCQNGVAGLSTDPGIVFVCHYATAGNYAGVSPYKKGKSCSGCGTETCENNLCRNSTRDTQKRYNWRPDWDPAISSCNSLCGSFHEIDAFCIPEK